MVNENDGITKLLENRLEEVCIELAKIDTDIEGFDKPFTKRESYPEGSVGTLAYLTDRNAHIDLHLYGKYSSGKLQKLYAKKLELVTQESDIRNELDIRRRRYDER